MIVHMITNQNTSPPAGRRGARRICSCICLVLFLSGAVPVAVDGYTVRYREELYQYYHRHAANNPRRIRENIYYMEQVLRADYANPLNALAVIEDTEQWQYYRTMFDMHIQLKLCELYLQLAGQYIKYNVNFYNYPWQGQNVKSLRHAADLLEYGRLYWQTAAEISSQAADMPAYPLEGVEYWVDQHARINAGELNYDTIIDRHMDLVATNIAAFEAMDASTY